jgi:diadenosine tetraphosphate (Ap4A) HIT family hydrolase
MTRDVPPCPFCARLAQGPLLAASAAAVAFADGHPLHPGHTLVVPRVHVADLFDLPRSVQAEVWALVSDVRELIRRQHQPVGFNVGLNAGAAAGQTVAHAHVHVIPRHTGDVADPRGGVRWVIPARAKYWEPPA